MTNKLSILVVDDNEGVRIILDEYLSWCGHNVKVVDTGAEAIELCMNKHFDLVLTDLDMPDVTGYDVIVALNGLYKRPKIGVVTGSSQEIKLVKGVDLRVDFIVRKPFNLSNIARNINDIFDVLPK